jgi:hypothetical protein
MAQTFIDNGGIEAIKLLKYALSASLAKTHLPGYDRRSMDFKEVIASILKSIQWEETPHSALKVYPEAVNTVSDLFASHGITVTYTQYPLAAVRAQVAGGLSSVKPHRPSSGR